MQFNTKHPLAFNCKFIKHKLCICIGLTIGLYILIRMSLGCSFLVLGIVSSNYHIIQLISSSCWSRLRLCKRQQWMVRLGTNIPCMSVLPRISLNYFLRTLRKLLTRLFLIIQFFKHRRLFSSRWGHFPTQQWITFISRGGDVFWHGVCYELNNPQHSGFWYHVDLLEISNHSQNHMESVWEYLRPTCLSLLLLVRQGSDP